jgi:hypothetical protein
MMRGFRRVTVGGWGSRWFFLGFALIRGFVRPLSAGDAGIGRRVAGREALFQGLVADAFRVSVPGLTWRFLSCGTGAGHHLERLREKAVHLPSGPCEAAGMTAPVRLGMLTPSSNTTLEPVTTAMLASFPSVSLHFSRFRVTEIALTGEALAQFDDRPILAAAELLAHAKVDVIAWNGTSSGWLGFDADQRLCERIEASTGIRASTSMLALNEILATTGVKRFGLASDPLYRRHAAAHSGQLRDTGNRL